MYQHYVFADTQQPPCEKVLHFVYMLGFCTKLRRLILIYELFLTNTTFRSRTKLRHLTYWLKWRVHSAIIGDSITPATPP